MTNPTPTDADVQYLRQNPQFAERFDANFGPGTSAQFLQEAEAAQPAASEDPSIVGDMGQGVLTGALDAVSETAQFLKDNIPSPAGMLDKASEAAGLGSILPDETDAEIDLNEDLGLSQPVTTAGQITHGITQFAVGFMGAGKVTGIANTVKGAMAKGFIADAVAFDPFDGNLQNFLDENGWAIPVVSDALAVDPEDPAFVARLKNGVDGLASGAVVDQFVKGVKAVALAAKARKASDPAAAQSLMEQASTLADEVAVAGDDLMENGIPADALREASEVASEIVKPTKGPKTDYVSTDKLRLAVDGAAATRHVIQEGEAAGSLDKLLTGDWFNYSKMDGPVEAQALIDTMGKALTDSGALKAFGLDQPETLAKTTDKAAREVASMIGTGIDNYASRIQSLAEGGKDQAKTIVAGKMVLQSLGREITRVAEQVDNLAKGGKGNEEIERKLIQLMETHTSIQLHLKSAQTAAARATSAGRIRTGDALDQAAVDKLLKYGGSKGVRDLAAKLRAASGDNQIARVVRRATKNGAWDVVNEYWINSILSGYKTHAVNMTSNALNVALLPMERAVGGVVDGLRGRGFDQTRAGLYQYTALRSASMDAVRLAGRSFMDEKAILDTATKLEVHAGSDKAITAQTFGYDDEAIGGQLINGAGKLLRLPSRMLMAEDEFFKQLTFRSRLKADIMVAARGMKDAELKRMGYASQGEFVEGEFEKAFTRTADLEVEWQGLVQKGRVKDDPDLKEAFFKDNLDSYREGSKYAEAAIRTARAATFTTPLREGSFSRNYQQFANRHPILRQITPFIQTPVNILSTAWDRTPALNLLRKSYRERLASPDPSIRAEASGQMATGVAITSAVYFLAAEGMITGGGPTDPAKAAVWKQDPNWQPYSINIGTAEKPNWVEYRRMDPHGFLFGVVGDIMEMQQAAEMDPSFDTANLFAMTAAAVANNLTSKTWLQGIADTVEVLNSKDRPWVVQRWAEDKAASFSPFSSFGGQLNQALDEYATEARGVVDKVKSKVPGMTAELPTRYNWMTGESIETPSHLLGYIRVKSDKANPVGDELRRLNYGFSGPDRKIGEIELNSEQYQEWNRLMGTVKIGKYNLQERLEKTIQSGRYDAKRERVPDGISDPSESHRVRMLAAVVQRYKQRAKQELFEKYPEVYDAYRQFKKFELRAKTGRAQPGERENLILGF